MQKYKNSIGIVYYLCFMQKKILISGANGFIGKHLCQFFIEKKYDVYALVRSMPTDKIEGVHYQKFELETVDTNLIKAEYDAFIHAAYIPSEAHSDSVKVNIQASKTMYQECISKDIHFVFISSLSALPISKSKYGRSKFATEIKLDSSKCSIVRPGLVIGNGGLYKSMNDFIQKSSLIPLFGGGNQVIQQIRIEDLCQIFYQIVETKKTGEFTVAENQSLTLKEWYQSLANSLLKSIRFISIPYLIADILFFVIDILPLKLGVGKENYLGLKQMQERKLTDSKNEFGIDI